jgi:hypothetical protein
MTTIKLGTVFARLHVRTKLLLFFRLKRCQFHTLPTFG